MIMAHRGASGYAPENTMASFKYAEKAGAPGIEFDVQLTRDNHIVVFHDLSVERTTNGSGRIADLAYAEIAQFDAGSWFGSKYAGEKVPLLTELMEKLPDSMFFNIEVKKPEGDERPVEQFLLEILEKHNRLEKTIVTSLNHQLLVKLRALNPAVTIGAVIEANLVDPIRYFTSPGFNVEVVSAYHELLSQSVVEGYLSAGISVYAWTVNDGQRAKQLLDWGVETAISNYPDLLER